MRGFKTCSFQSCTYNSETDSLIISGSNVGTFLKYDPTLFEREHLLNDVYYKAVCCVQADLCNLYYEVRPRSTTCSDSTDFTFGIAFLNFNLPC